MSASFLDIAPQKIMVPIGDVEMECHGIGSEGIAQLMVRFPGLRGLLFPEGQRQATEELSDPLALIHGAPETIAAVIAAGTGHLGDKEQEAAIARLPIEPQVDLLSAILKLTLPGGFVPFMEKVTAIFGLADESPQALPNGAALHSSASLPGGKGQDTSSPSKSAGSSGSGTDL